MINFAEFKLMMLSLHSLQNQQSVESGPNLAPGGGATGPTMMGHGKE